MKSSAKRVLAEAAESDACWDPGDGEKLVWPSERAHAFGVRTAATARPRGRGQGRPHVRKRKVGGP